MQTSENALTVPTAESVAIPAAVAAIVPLAHHEEFHNCTTDDQRQRIAVLLQMFDAIRSSPEGVVATCHRLALEHPGRGFSAANLKTLYYAYKKTKDWRVLVPQWRGSSAVPADFVEFFRRRVEQNKRENPARAVMMQIKAEWAQGESIPGYGTWREYYATTFPERDTPDRYPFGFFPRGWSQSNLYTKQSTKAERALARRGFSAAKAYLHHVIRDTRTLRPMELITIDDFETDIIVQARNPNTGRFEICTCTGLLALDVATRCRVGFGLKPRFKHEDGRKMAITRADVQGLLFDIFSTHGLPQGYGVTILCENAAAAITDDVAQMLQTLLGVQVARTGLIADKVLANGFVERGGKPWEKGWIESLFNLAWNHAGAFAGQKGARYQLEPGDHAAKLLYAEKLLNTEGLTQDQVAQLQTGFWLFDDAITAYTRVFDFLEQRTHHTMQGFEELYDYRLPDGSGCLTLAQAQQLDRDTLLACTPLPRKESPRERWARLTQGLSWVRVQEHALALLLLTPKKVKLQNLRLTFTHLGEGYTFADADSPVMRLPEGTDLLGYLDPSAPNVLHVTYLHGRYIGAVRRRGAVDIRDRAALAEEQGEITRLITKHVLAPVRARHEDENKALLAMRESNAAKLEAWAKEAASQATPARAGVTQALATGRPGAQPHHAAAAAQLAAGIAATGEVERRGNATAKALQRADDLDATALF